MKNKNETGRTRKERTNNDARKKKEKIHQDPLSIPGEIFLFPFPLQTTLLQSPFPRPRDSPEEEVPILFSLPFLPHSFCSLVSFFSLCGLVAHCPPSHLSVYIHYSFEFLSR